MEPGPSSVIVTLVPSNASDVLPSTFNATCTLSPSGSKAVPVMSVFVAASVGARSVTNSRVTVESESLMTFEVLGGLTPLSAFALKHLLLSAVCAVNA